MPPMMTPNQTMNAPLNAPGTPTSLGVASQPHPNKPLFPSAAAMVKNILTFYK